MQGSIEVGRKREYVAIVTKNLDKHILREVQNIAIYVTDLDCFLLIFCFHEFYVTQGVVGSNNIDSITIHIFFTDI